MAAVTWETSSHDPGMWKIHTLNITALTEETDGICTVSGDGTIHDDWRGNLMSFQFILKLTRVTSGDQVGTLIWLPKEATMRVAGSTAALTFSVEQQYIHPGHALHEREAKFYRKVATARRLPS
jgi:hypothetical protein